MIPLGDASRRLRNFPIMTLLIIITNAVVFLQELQAGERFVYQWALVPAEVVQGRDLITVITAMFLHAGWAHIISNMTFLWAFGPAIEDAMRPLKYLVFYLLAGIAATAAQVYFDPTSSTPNLGASGAIAGVMGGFLITYPADRIRTVLFLGFLFTVAFIPAIVLIGLWFITQLFNGYGAITGILPPDGIAYIAHIGGFVFGLLVARFLETRRALRVARVE
jgi:membrane associated rhomboid family serine protease